MVRSQIIAVQKENIIIYPCLMENKTTGLIVLLSEYGVGMVIHADRLNYHPVGKYSTSWFMDDLILCPKEVKLSNKPSQ